MKVNIKYDSEQASRDITIILNPSVKEEARELHHIIAKEVSDILEELI
jgi:hypothetical protein